jgi:hypothetical protein
VARSALDVGATARPLETVRGRLGRGGTVAGMLQISVSAWPAKEFLNRVRKFDSCRGTLREPARKSRFLAVSQSHAGDRYEPPSTSCLPARFDALSDRAQVRFLLHAAERASRAGVMVGTPRSPSEQPSSTGVKSQDVV